MDPRGAGRVLHLLECVPNALLLLALLLLGSRRADRVPYALLAGAALGLGVSIKIWGVVPLLVVLGWQLLSAGRRRALTVLAGAVAAAVVVCAVPFVLAPGRMCWYVVTDQLVRSGAPRPSWPAPGASPRSMPCSRRSAPPAPRRAGAPRPGRGGARGGRVG